MGAAEAPPPLLYGHPDLPLPALLLREGPLNSLRRQPSNSQEVMQNAGPDLRQMRRRP